MKTFGSCPGSCHQGNNHGNGSFWKRRFESIVDRDIVFGHAFTLLIVVLFPLFGPAPPTCLKRPTDKMKFGVLSCVAAVRFQYLVPDKTVLTWFFGPFLPIVDEKTVLQYTFSCFFSGMDGRHSEMFSPPCNSR